MIGLKSPGSEAPSFFGIKVVLNTSKRCGSLPHRIKMLNILHQMLDGTFRSSLTVHPSGPVAEPKGGKTALTSSRVTGVHRSVMTSFPDIGPGELKPSEVMIVSQNGTMISFGGVYALRLSRSKSRIQDVRLRFHAF